MPGSKFERCLIQGVLFRNGKVRDVQPSSQQYTKTGDSLIDEQHVGLPEQTETSVSVMPTFTAPHRSLHQV